MQNTPITVRTLLLGYPSAPTYNPNLFQFGLLPEEEATQVADRAWQDGKRISAIFYPNNTWGKRLRHAFDNRWAELGGIVAESQSYDPAEIDYSQRIKNLLNIDDSIGRNRKLTTILRRNIDFQPRRRSDIDFVFVAGHPQQGRLIKPQLNFYNAHKLPVYSTSHIYSGNPDKINDTDLNNVIFNDMPWLLKKEGKIANLRQSMMADHDDNGFHRLFALGVDTYQLAINIPVIQVDSGMMIDGVTARLSVDEDQRIVRKLLFARFDEGLPKLLDNNIAGISVELPIPK